MGRGGELVVMSTKKHLSYCLFERLMVSTGVLTTTRSTFMAFWETHCVGTCFVAGLVTLLQETLQCVSGEWQYTVTATGSASGRPKPWMISVKPRIFYCSTHIFTHILLNLDHSSVGASVFWWNSQRKCWWNRSIVFLLSPTVEQWPVKIQWKASVI